MGMELPLNSMVIIGTYLYCDPFPVELLHTKPVTSLWEFMQHLNPGRFKISRADFCHLYNLYEFTQYGSEGHVFVLCGTLTGAAQTVGAVAGSLSMKISMSLH